MIQTRLFLQCEGKGCEEPFPSFNGKAVVVDGAFYTHGQLRAEARKTGWQRYGGHDYCSRCEISHRAEAVKGGN